MPTSLDALSFESHFLDHIRPVWRELRKRNLAGRLVVERTLVDRAEGYGFGDLDVYDAVEVRRRERYPEPRPGDGPTALVASYGDIKLGRRLGYRNFVFLEHGAGQSYEGDRRQTRHPSYAGGIDREDVALFLVPNEYSAKRWRAAYPAVRTEIVGSPKLDDLPARGPGPRPTVAVSFHWDSSIIPEIRSALGHYRAVLPALAERFAVIGHGHPRAYELARVYRRLGIEYVPEFEEVCRRADVYACDNSSTLFEFAALDRPVVVLNAPWYRRNVEHGLRFWEARSIGVNVDEPAYLADGVAYALEDDAIARRAREKALRLVYTYRSGGAVRAADAIAEFLGG